LFFFGIEGLGSLASLAIPSLYMRCVKTSLCVFYVCRRTVAVSLTTLISLVQPGTINR